MFPTNVTGIRLDLKCRRLHFLHGAIWGSGSPGTQVGRYVLRYADGAIREKGIVLGQDLLDWWKPPEAGATVRGLVIAWEGQNAATRRESRADIRLYKTTWENPRTEVGIQTLDFVSDMAKGAPFLIAVTVE